MQKKKKLKVVIFPEYN